MFTAPIKKNRTLLFFLILIGCSSLCSARWNQAQWVVPNGETADNPGAFILYSRDFDLASLKGKPVDTYIAVDSKYWLWVNGKQVVFEGGLKRGPNPSDTYYDHLDIAPYLKKGRNEVKLLVWYFGRSGFSHLDSGKSGLLFSAPTISLYSDQEWKCLVLPEYGICTDMVPNWRLSESSIRYDARKALSEETQKQASQHVQCVGPAGCPPWNKLIPRPIPLFRYEKKPQTVKFKRAEGLLEDTLKARLPYNMQFTPSFTLDDQTEGQLVRLETNHLRGGGDVSVRAEYITRKGKQSYESLGWMNGEELYVIVPKGMKINRLSYRESGYDTSPEGTFSCDNDFINRFWTKALNTLYVNMRDTYFDCPDRERAQWWGDVCVLMGESFCTFDTRSHLLMRKGILELCAFQHPDGRLHSPIPGIYEEELPAQMLSAIGLYGIWNYFMNTADLATIRTAYPHVRDYLNVWSFEENGLTAERHGGWDWGDWGENRDIRLLYAAWHYMALDAASRMASLLDKPVEAAYYQDGMKRLYKGFQTCWNGRAYKHPDFSGEVDDRVQALAVISGLASEDKYPALSEVFHTTMFSSPYMEKYVMEALFMMGEGRYELERMRTRYAAMVDDPCHTTMYEGWNIGDNNFGGGTTNHAWSGGPLTVITQYLMGIKPVAAGWSQFEIRPDIHCGLEKARITIPTTKGQVSFSFDTKGDKMVYKVKVPKQSETFFWIPSPSKEQIKGSSSKWSFEDTGSEEEGRYCLRLPAGKYTFSVKPKSL